jgi:hypothetical protein
MLAAFCPRTMLAAAASDRETIFLSTAKRAFFVGRGVVASVAASTRSTFSESFAWTEGYSLLLNCCSIV